MPELPDVEIFKRYVDSTSLHKQVSHVEVKNKKILKNISAAKIEKLLQGQKLQHSSRHGKFLFVKTGNGWFIMHFGMTGELKYYKDGEQAEYAKFIIGFENGYRLYYISRRMLGWVSWTESMNDFLAEEKTGPDAMDISREDFTELLSGHKGAIKPLLMNQKVIAGIGNIYSDEILFQSGISPEKGASSIGKNTAEVIYKNLRMVLRRAVERSADPKKLPQDYLLPHREKKGNCPKCGNALRVSKVGGRTAYYCTKCQK